MKFKDSDPNSESSMWSCSRSEQCSRCPSIAVQAGQLHCSEVRAAQRERNRCVVSRRVRRSLRLSGEEKKDKKAPILIIFHVIPFLIPSLACFRVVCAALSTTESKQARRDSTSQNTQRDVLEIASMHHPPIVGAL